MTSIEDKSGSTSTEQVTESSTGTETTAVFAGGSPDTIASSTESHVKVQGTAAQTHPPQASIKNMENTPTMLVADTESKQLLKDILQTLRSSTIAQETGTDSRSRLWATYRREAREFDIEFLEKYRDDMDIVLIFAGLFSAVSTTFITSMQSSLSPDPTATTNILLMQLVQATNASAFADKDLKLPSWNGPGPTVIWTQSLIYASLAASLLAALGAVLGKQWLAHYRQSKFGTSEQRALYRQAKSDALERWRFQAMLGVLPVLLQISLLLFGIALSAYVWTQQSTIAAVVIGATAMGILFYVLITLASAFSYDCPFQTPLANVIKLLWKPIALFRKSSPKLYWASVQTYWNKISWSKRRLPDAENPATSPPSPSPKVDLRIYEHEAPAVRWLLETSTDQEVLLIPAQMVPDIEWPVEVDVSGIYAQLGNAFRGCFVFVPGGTDLIIAPFAQNRAFVFGKALLHLFCNRLYLSNTTTNIPLGDRDYNVSLFDCFECLAKFGGDTSAPFLKAMAHTLLDGALFGGGSFPITQYDSTWTLRLLPHLLAHPCCSLEVRMLAVREIVGWLASPSPPQQIFGGCSLSIAIMLGAPVDRKDLVKYNSNAADVFLRKYLRQPASPFVSEITGHSNCSCTVCWQDTLLLSLSAVLERGRVYQGTGHADFCGTVNCVMLIYATCMARLQLATVPESRAELLRRARAALHLGAMLSAISCDDSLDRWNPTYLSSPLRFNIDGPESAVYFLEHHLGLGDDVAVADALFMLSQSRNIEQWANSSSFIDQIIRAMQHQREHVRHSALQVVRRLRHTLKPSQSTVIPVISANLRAIISSLRFEADTQLLCCLQIIFTFALHHDSAWVADFLQMHSDSCLRHAESMSKDIPPYSMYLPALLAIAEDHDIECDFRSSFSHRLRAWHLRYAWEALASPKEQVLDSDALDEVLPNFIAFTIRYQSDYGSTRFLIREDPECLRLNLQKNRPESPSIKLLQEMISKLPPYK